MFYEHFILHDSLLIMENIFFQITEINQVNSSICWAGVLFLIIGYQLATWAVIFLSRTFPNLSL